MNMLPEAEGHYLAGFENGRLQSPTGRLEFLRSLSIFSRFGPSAPARLLDLGGGTGPYAFHLARQGYEVELVDAMPLHIEQAMAHPDSAMLKSISVGDARSLGYEEASFDAVLLMGPLYHLTEREDRLAALREVYRVLRPGGRVFAAVISRFASLIDGFLHGLIADPLFEEIVRQDLIDGQHRNPTDHPDYFTTAKFHKASELAEEMAEAGYADPQVLAVEGFGSVIPNMGEMDEGEFNRLMHFLVLVESEPEIIGVSSHLMGISTKC
ncbi:MAG: methyltransferase domain-containing protein [Fimbriimonadaceae bacterium]